MISVVTSLYRSEPTVRPFYDRTLAVLKELEVDYEFIFVDDGSPDNVAGEVLELRKQDPKVQLLELAKNFGQHEAIMTGLEHVSGDYVFVLDSDLEEPPEQLAPFYRELINHEPELDVIYAYMPKRKGKFVERLGGAIFFLLINKLASIDVPPNILVLRLMRLEYVQALVQHSEHHLFLGGLLARTGFRQKGVPVKKGFKGYTSYTFSKRLKGAVNAILSFSDRPILVIALLGFFITGISMVVILGLLVHYVVFRGSVAGWTSVMVSVWLLSGLILFALGVIGLYVGKIFIQTKQRPRSIIRRHYK